MGQHDADLGAIDGVVEADHPEVLPSEHQKSQPELVGVEYVDPQDPQVARCP
jgi:hypothetical protein